MINKKLIHFNNFSVFNTKKLSSNTGNTQYTVGVTDTVVNGNPDIPYLSIVFIKDTNQIWTHGAIYSCPYSKEELNLFTSNLKGDVSDDYNTLKKIEDIIESLKNNKVDKVTGKELSTNDYTTTDKDKLSGIEEGALVNTITGVKGNAETTYRIGNINITPANIGLGNVDNTSDANKPVSTAQQTALDKKVDKVSGKDLSTNDYTTAEKNKLAGIEANAQVNTVNSVAGRTGDILLSKNDVGLNAVDNTSDMDKPISNATQQALDNKANFSDLSNVLAEEVIDNPLLGEINTLTREEIKKDLFIDMWNEACGSYGTYNAETDFFELNGLTDITYEEALTIYNYTAPCGNSGEQANKYTQTNIRTNLPPVRSCFDQRIVNSMFYNCKKLEVVNLAIECNPSNADGWFNGCSNLRTIMGYISFSYAKKGYWNRLFDDCVSLVDVTFNRIGLDVSLKDSPNISLFSLRETIDKASNNLTTAITITVHPDVYAKLTDTTNTEWNKVLTDAAAKNISFATA